VRVKGLVKAAQHNGEIGVLNDRATPEGRVGVDLVKGQTLSIREENLGLVRPCRSSGHRDTLAKEKEEVNVRLADLRGCPSENQKHALHLGGSEMRTTTALLQLQKGWPPERLHVPNCCKSDFVAMQAKATGINLCPCTSTKLLKDLLQENWVAQLLQEGRSPFSFVCLDCTNVKSREEDLSLLLGHGLL
jgi:hypothetical protein